MLFFTQICKMVIMQYRNLKNHLAHNFLAKEAEEVVIHVPGIAKQVNVLVIAQILTFHAGRKGMVIADVTIGLLVPGVVPYILAREGLIALGNVPMVENVYMWAIVVFAVVKNSLFGGLRKKWDKITIIL